MKKQIETQLNIGLCVVFDSCINSKVRLAYFIFVTAISNYSLYKAKHLECFRCYHEKETGEVNMVNHGNYSDCSIHLTPFL